MDRRHVNRFAGVLAAASAGFSHARAQETITLSVAYSDSLLEPEETQHIEVWATLQPGLGSHVPWNTNGGTGALGSVLAFGYAHFDLRNVLGGTTGLFSELALNPAITLFPGSAVGTPDPGGNVVVISLMQQWIPPILNPSNPILLWTATWTPNEYTPRTIEFVPAATGTVGVFLSIPGGSSIPGLDDWTPIHVGGAFQIVPAPGCLALLATTGVCCARRRRAALRFSEPTPEQVARGAGS